MSELLRVYVPDEDEFDSTGYPRAWRDGDPAIKDLVRERAGHRCVRCGHPYKVRESPPEWSPCDEQCVHFGPFRHELEDGEWIVHDQAQGISPYIFVRNNIAVEAHWRILTVHHLNNLKADCRWWNLVALCQRCHLEIQGRVVMHRAWPWDHTTWFRPYVAGFYASKYLGVDLTRAESEARLDELLHLGKREEAVERMPVG